MNDTEMKTVDFGEAIRHVKSGGRAARAGWNGKGMWIAYGHGTKDLPADKFWIPANREFAEQNGGKADVLPYFTFKTADNKILMGWLASQTDMDATDWVLM